jgi:hypothetical protein
MSSDLITDFFSRTTAFVPVPVCSQYKLKEASVSMDSWAMHAQKCAQPSGVLPRVLYARGEACVRAAVAWVGRARVAVSLEMGE